MNWKSYLCGSASVLALGLMALPAGAQDATAASSDDLETVVVTGIRASLEKGLEVKRESTQVVESIAAEDIGKFPDNNVVEALQRISGVQVTDRTSGEVSTISIRGMSDIETTWNGRKLFTSDARYFSVQDMPATLVSRLDTYKTRGSNQIESGIGGVIDVKTHRPFDFDDFKFSVQVRDTYSEQAGSFDPNIGMLIADTWHTPYGKIGVMANLSYSTNHYRQEGAAQGAMIPYASSDVYDGTTQVFAKGDRIYSSYTTKSSLSVYTPSYNSGDETVQITMWKPGMQKGLSEASGATLTAQKYTSATSSTLDTTSSGITIPYVLGRDAVYMTDYVGNTTRPNFNFAMQWQPNDSALYTFEFMYNGYRNHFDDRMLFFDIFYSDAYNDGTIDYDDAYTVYDGTNVIKTLDTAEQYSFISGDYGKSKTNSFVYAFNAQWAINDRFNLTSDFTYQKSRYDYSFFAIRLDRTQSEISVDMNDTGGTMSITLGDDDVTALTDPSSWMIDWMYDNGSYAAGHAYTFTTDGVYDLDGMAGPLKKLSFGMRIDDRGAKAGERSASGNYMSGTVDYTAAELAELVPGILMTNSNFFKGVGNVPHGWLNISGRTAYKHRNAIRQLYGGKMTSDLYETMFQDFQIDEINTAAYVMADFEYDLYGSPITLNAGLRWVEIKDSTKFWDYDTYISKGAVPDDEDGTGSSHAFLPSITLAYSPMDDLKFRFSYSQTLRNPDFDDLNPSRTLSADVTNIGYGTGDQGNPDLKPTKSTNYDLTAEWYFAKNSALYTTFFRRDISNLVVSLEQSLNIAGDDIASSYNTNNFMVSTPVNSSKGWLKGIEVGTVYFPDYLPGWLDGFGFQGSMTFLASRQDIPETNDVGTVTGHLMEPFLGVSAVSYNTTLIYEHEGFSTRVSYVWRSHWHNADESASFANPLGIWRRGESSLDLSSSYDLGNGAMFTFDAVNLLNGKEKEYYANAGSGGKSIAAHGTYLYDRRFSLGFRFETD